MSESMAAEESTPVIETPSTVQPTTHVAISSQAVPPASVSSPKIAETYRGPSVAALVNRVVDIAIPREVKGEVWYAAKVRERDSLRLKLALIEAQKGRDNGARPSVQMLDRMLRVIDGHEALISRVPVTSVPTENIATARGYLQGLKNGAEHESPEFKYAKTLAEELDSYRQDIADLMGKARSGIGAIVEGVRSRIAQWRGGKQEAGAPESSPIQITSNAEAESA